MSIHLSIFTFKLKISKQFIKSDLLKDKYIIIICQQELSHHPEYK